MVYEFDLQVSDYIAGSLAATTNARLLRGYVPYALIAALVAWIVAYVVFGESTGIASIVGVVVFGLLLSYLLFIWRSTFTKTLTRYYDTPAKRAVLGPHTLELAEDGLHSQGPLHRSFRAWPAITQAVVTSSHCFFHTAFGLVYVLPMRAVPDRDALMAKLSGKGIAVTQR